MSTDINDALHWAFGRGFWYADAVKEVQRFSEEDLYWSLTPNIPCMLWHVGHIAHRECFHIRCMLEGNEEGSVIPKKFGILFDTPYDADEFRQALPDPGEVFDWANGVREHSHKFISKLGPEDYNTVPESSFEGNSIARVLMQTIGHTGVHLGRIQLLQQALEASRNIPGEESADEKPAPADKGVSREIDSSVEHAITTYIIPEQAKKAMLELKMNGIEAWLKPGYHDENVGAGIGLIVVTADSERAMHIMDAKGLCPYAMMGTYRDRRRAEQVHNLAEFKGIETILYEIVDNPIYGTGTALLCYDEVSQSVANIITSGDMMPDFHWEK